MIRVLLFVATGWVSSVSQAFENTASPLNLTGHWVGITAVVIFALAYLLVIFEEQIHLRKSKPILLASGLIWILIAWVHQTQGMTHAVEDVIRHTFLEYAELFFFLLVAMTYINALLERGVFEELRNRLVAAAFSYRTLFWLTGSFAFLLSPVADNLTTALIMCAVILTVGQDQRSFITLGCINIVVAANAGGAFSPFGDITTLMVWQKGMVQFWEFFHLFLPSMVNFVLPAMIMQFFLPKGKPTGAVNTETSLKYGGLTIAWLFGLTITTAVCFHQFLGLPPVFGMMTGLAYLKFYGFYLTRKSRHWLRTNEYPPTSKEDPYNFDVFSKIAGAEWDTLFFFYGVILAVGGLGFIGYLGLMSEWMYTGLGTTEANILVGLLSAIVDNIPVMFAVLTMQPDMPLEQWLLVTLTAGVGGSLLSIGSAAGVALMGQARGHYTFFSHLKWSPVIALGYAASIMTHLWLVQ